MDERIAQANELAAQGLTVREIAERLGMTEQALRSMMSRDGRRYVVTAGQFLKTEEGDDNEG